MKFIKICVTQEAKLTKTSCVAWTNTFFTHLFLDGTQHILFTILSVKSPWVRTHYIRFISTTLIPTELTSHMCICCFFSFIFQHTITYTLLLSEYKETLSVWHLHFSNGPVPKKTSRWMVLSSIYNRNDNICIHFSNSSNWARPSSFDKMTI